SHVLVSTLRLRAPARKQSRGCGGLDASVLRALPGKEIPGPGGKREREVPLFPAGFPEPFPFRRARSRPGYQTRCRADTSFAVLAGWGGPLRPGTGGKQERGEDF